MADRIRRILIFFCAMIAVLSCLTNVLGADQETLDNGLVRLTFDRSTGLFQTYSLNGGQFRLLDAGPAFQINGGMISPASSRSWRHGVNRSKMLWVAARSSSRYILSRVMSPASVTN